MTSFITIGTPGASSRGQNVFLIEPSKFRGSQKERPDKNTSANHLPDSGLQRGHRSNSRFLATALALLASKLLTRLLAIDEKVNCEGDMLWTLFVILLVLWLLGVVSSYTMGGFIHILLVLALVALVFQLITGRRAAV